MLESIHESPSRSHFGSAPNLISPRSFLGSPRGNLGEVRNRRVKAFATKVRCPHCSKERDTDHVGTCGQRPVRCDICQSTMTALEYVTHRPLCLQSMAQCPFCHGYAKKDDITGHVRNRCAYRLVVCDTCRETMTAKDCYAHRSTCKSKSRQEVPAPPPPAPTPSSSRSIGTSPMRRPSAQVTTTIVLSPAAVHTIERTTSTEPTPAKLMVPADVQTHYETPNREVEQSTQVIPHESGSVLPVVEEIEEARPSPSMGKKAHVVEAPPQVFSPGMSEHDQWMKTVACTQLIEMELPANWIMDDKNNDPIIVPTEKTGVPITSSADGSVMPVVESVGRPRRRATSPKRPDMVSFEVPCTVEVVKPVAVKASPRSPLKEVPIVAPPPPTVEVKTPRTNTSEGFVKPQNPDPVPPPPAPAPAPAVIPVTIPSPQYVATPTPPTHPPETQPTVNVAIPKLKMETITPPVVSPPSAASTPRSSVLSRSVKSPTKVAIEVQSEVRNAVESLDIDALLGRPEDLSHRRPVKEPVVVQGIGFLGVVPVKPWLPKAPSL